MLKTLGASTVLHRAPLHNDKDPCKGDCHGGFGDVLRNVQDILATSTKDTLRGLNDNDVMTVGGFKQLMGVHTMTYFIPINKC